LSWISEAIQILKYEIFADVTGWNSADDACLRI